jgi:type II secretory pathway pseudopilin PulG
LIELMIVVAVIAVVSSVAVPKLMSSRLAANESAAISNLRAITSAQEQFRSMNAVDSDGDGGGEYGFLGELAGTAPLREFSGGGAAIGIDPLQPAVLSNAFGIITADGGAEGYTTRSGYCFKVYLPAASAGGVTPAIAEDGGSVGGATAGSEPSGQNCEILWCAYAWPIEAAKTGNRVFCVNQDGELIQFANKAGVYSGPDAGPASDAAYSSASAGNMGAALAIVDGSANDGNAWTPLN